jgi:hypothetical protein
MSAPIIDICGDVVDEINSTIWSMSIAAELDYAANYDRHDLTATPYVAVVPASYTAEPETERSDRVEYRVDIGLVAHCETIEETNAMLDLCDEIMMHFRAFRSTTVIADVMRVEWAPIYQAEDLRESMLFASAIRLFFAANRSYS